MLPQECCPKPLIRGSISWYTHSQLEARYPPRGLQIKTLKSYSTAARTQGKQSERCIDQKANHADCLLETCLAVWGLQPRQRAFKRQGGAREHFSSVPLQPQKDLQKEVFSLADSAPPKTLQQPGRQSSHSNWLSKGRRRPWNPPILPDCLPQLAGSSPWLSPTFLLH